MNLGRVTNLELTQ